MSHEGVVKFFNRTDWKLLRRQKTTLVETIETLGLTLEQKEIHDDLQGIVHLLDALQDTAQDELGIEVFKEE